MKKNNTLSPQKLPPFTRIRIAQTTFAAIVYIFTILISAKTCLAIDTNITESDVFEWWDNGIISQDEAEDILSLLEEDNNEEACYLAEIYAQEPCNTTKTTKKTFQPSKKKHQETNLIPHGFVLWKGRIDSTGHITHHREKLQITFYHYTLHLGSQELLSYKNNHYEAHFGDISTKEIHSQIPLDTLWGSAILVPIQNFYIGGILDTSITSQIQVGFSRKQYNISAMYWNSEGISSGLFQAHLRGLNIALWKQQNQNYPLIKIKFQYSETEKEINKLRKKFKLSWNTMAYIHGNDTPTHAKLGTSILKNKLWASQNISADIPKFSHTKITGNANIAMPLDRDTLKARFKVAFEIGPPSIHTKITTICLDAANQCQKTDWSIKATSQHGASEAILFDFFAKTRYEKQKKNYAGFNAPRLESGISYLSTDQKKIRIALIFPKGTPSEGFTLRNESEINSNVLDYKVLVDFEQNKKKDLHPKKVTFMLKYNF